MFFKRDYLSHLKRVVPSQPLHRRSTCLQKLMGPILYNLKALQTTILPKTPTIIANNMMKGVADSEE